MKIDVRAASLTPLQLHDIAATLRANFRELAHQVTRVVVAVTQSAGKRSSPCLCVIEVHMVDGRVERIEEQQRRLGSALRRAVLRAWRSAAQHLSWQPRDQLRLLPAPVKAADDARDSHPKALR